MQLNWRCKLKFLHASASGNMQLKWGKRGKSNLFSHRIFEFGKEKSINQKTLTLISFLTKAISLEKP